MKRKLTAAQRTYLQYKIGLAMEKDPEYAAKILEMVEDKKNKADGGDTPQEKK